MKNYVVSTPILLIMLFSAVFWGCDRPGKAQYGSFPIFSSYRDIPGVTDEEAAAIEALKGQTGHFIYGMPLSTEAFSNGGGEVRGFAAAVCEWLTELFGIPFRPALYDWHDLLAGLETREISFSGELTSTTERLTIYHMTEAIALRPVKSFRIAGSRPFGEILAERPLRTGFIKGTATIRAVTADMEPGTFEVVEIDNFAHVYDMLRSEGVDAFYYSGVAEINFIDRPDVVTREIYPLTYMPVSLSTRNPDFAPIISVVDKALKSGALQHLTTMYNRSHEEYMRFKLHSRLTEEELAYIAGNPVVPIGVDPGNYPGCFYDRREKEWRGISLDILDEIASLTGLTFKRVNDQYTEWPVIYQKLQSGEIAMVPELTQMAERMGQFIWPETVLMIDHYALISNTDFPDIKINEVLHARVGLARNTSYATVFRKWFPGHTKTFDYESVEEAFSALVRGEIDMVMANQKRTLYLTHYLELPNYKANIVFNYAIDIKFGLNKDETILNSIIDKALSCVDSRGIADYWMRKTYDYRSKVAEARMPWIIGATVLSLFVLTLMVLITKRKAATDAALAASRSKSTFLANMSHEIRTPMNAILGVTEIMAQKDELPKEVEEGLDKIYSSCGLLLGIINDILDFSKIEAGKLDIMPTEYKVASLISDSMQLNMMRIDTKPVKFELNIDENIPSRLVGDELRIKQILNNLLSNAFKYTDAGKVTMSVTAEAEPGSGRVVLVLSVRDTGHGMSKEQLDKMFDEYSRFNAEKNSSVEGTGLGLAITQRLISLIGGKITVESEPDKGSLFVVRLPQSAVHDGEPLGKDVAENLRLFRDNYMAHKRRAQIARDPMPYGKVLIVDDVETNLYVAAGLMKLYRLQIDTVMSGREAIAKIKSHKVYDIIFMDHMMPELDGIITTKYIRGFGYTAPIVALTANAVAGQAEFFQQNGFDDFISKPIDIRRLDSVLTKLIRDKQPPEVIEAARRHHGNSEHGHNAALPQIDSLFLQESFVRDAARAVALLEGLGQNREAEWIDNDMDLREFTIMVHGIKSSLRNIGEAELSDLACKLETAGRERDARVITAQTPVLLDKLRLLLEKMTPKHNTDGVDDDIEGLRGKLQAIREVCAAYNRKGALEILSGITKNCSKETRAAADHIIELVQQSDFEEAEAAAAEYAAELAGHA